jgi:DNA-binding MarR family transcriptional regulator
MTNTTPTLEDKPHDASSVLKKFRLIYGTVKQHFREVEQHCGISGSQLWLLQEIHHHPNIGVSNLANRLSIHQSTCSQLVEKLSKAKLIVKVRSAEDQRRVGLCTTESAVALLAKAPTPAEGVLPEALNAMSQDVLLQLDAALGKVIAQLSVRNNKLEALPLSEM